DHRRDVVVQDPRRDQVELEEPPACEHGVAGVVPALVADAEVHLVGEVVGGLALALVAPLAANDDRDRHGGIVGPVPLRTWQTRLRPGHRSSGCPNGAGTTARPSTRSWARPYSA